MLCCKADPQTAAVNMNVYVCTYKKAGSRTLLSPARWVAACKNKTRESMHCIKIPELEAADMRTGFFKASSAMSAWPGYQSSYIVRHTHAHAHTAQASPSVSEVCVSVSQQRASASSLAQRLSILAATMAREGSQTFRLFFDTGATNHGGGLY